MTMMLKLLLVMGLLAVAAIVLNKLFPAKGGDAPRSLNDLMEQLEPEEAEPEEAEGKSAADPQDAAEDAGENAGEDAAEDIGEAAEGQAE